MKSHSSTIMKTHTSPPLLSGLSSIVGGGIVIVLLAFFIATPNALACSLVCHGDYDPDGIGNPLDGVSYCHGSVEFQGCVGDDTDENPGGGGGGGGGGSFYPDMTASSITPQSATQGQARTFSATITNGGIAYAGDSTTRFQRATNGNGSGAYEVGSVATGALNPGASRNVSFSHTFTTSGTFYLRACADVGGTVSESNESNNCGPWTHVIVASPAPTVDLTAAPESITAGASSVLTWVSSNADTCSSAEFDTLGATSGQVSVAPGATTLYTIICHKNGSGTTGTYKYAYSDVSDHTCPITDPDTGYSGLPTCPSRLPEGRSCTGPCKVNLAGSYSNDACIIETQVYECNFTDGTSAQQVQDSATVTVTASGTDLTAGSATAPGAARGSTVAVSAPILNVGGTTAGASHAYYELVAPSSKSNASGVVSVGAIAASGSQNASFSYTFSASGTYQVRFCADWFGAVAETNEGNNCGPWTDISIPETPVANSVSCTVSSASVTAGQSVTYTAHPVGAATSPYTWTPSDGAGSYGSGSTASRTFMTPGSFGMQVSATNAGNAANCPVVTVGAGYCVSGTPDLTITATPTRVRAGQTTSLVWSASGVTGSGATCSVSGPNMTTWTSSVTAAPQCSAGSSQTVTVTTQSTYTLTCGAHSESVTVNVTPNFQEF